MARGKHFIQPISSGSLLLWEQSRGQKLTFRDVLTIAIYVDKAANKDKQQKGKTGKFWEQCFRYRQLISERANSLLHVRDERQHKWCSTNEISTEVWANASDNTTKASKLQSTTNRLAPLTKTSRAHKSCIRVVPFVLLLWQSNLVFALSSLF